MSRSARRAPAAAYPALTPALFSFNSPAGSCAGCNGLGTLRTIERDALDTFFFCALGHRTADHGCCLAVASRPFDVSGDVLENVDPIFYGDLRTAAFKALGLT